jgi:hypothetical protein
MKACAWCLIVWGLAASLSPLAAETLTMLSNDAFPNPKLPPVVFYHDAHNEQAKIDTCQTCHHVYEENRLVPDESSEGSPCAECHEAVHFGKDMTLSRAYHQRCKQCHLEVRQGPILCGQCHREPESPALGLAP